MMLSLFSGIPRLFPKVADSTRAAASEDLHKHRLFSAGRHRAGRNRHCRRTRVGAFGSCEGAESREPCESCTCFLGPVHAHVSALNRVAQQAVAKSGRIVPSVGYGLVFPMYARRKQPDLAAAHLDVWMSVT